MTSLELNINDKLEELVNSAENKKTILSVLLDDVSEIIKDFQTMVLVQEINYSNSSQGKASREEAYVYYENTMETSQDTPQGRNEKNGNMDKLWRGSHQYVGKGLNQPKMNENNKLYELIKSLIIHFGYLNSKSLTLRLLDIVYINIKNKGASNKYDRPDDLQMVQLNELQKLRSEVNEIKIRGIQY